jgi:Family of unknown function (DUF6527)
MAVGSRLRSLLSFVGIIRKPDVSARYVDDHPDRNTMVPKELYVVGDRRIQKWALMRCPCGCGETIMLSLSRKRRPSWSVQIDWLGRPTLQPSIRQTDGCYSHFWLKGGQLLWCVDTGKRWPSKMS